MNPVHVLGLSGSLRKASFNSAALRAAGDVLPEGMTLEIGSIAGLPLYDDDVKSAGFPEPVLALGRAIAAADAVLLVTPEYNYSVSGVLKNAIDWVSRLNPQPFAEKPVGVMGASVGVLGTARAQYHLRQIMVFLNAQVMPRPEVMIGGAPGKFDTEGRLTDAPTREFLGKYMAALGLFTRRWRAGHAAVS
jgi:chromate reductase